MKKFIGLTLFFITAFSAVGICSPADSAFRTILVGYGVNTTLAWVIVSALGLLAGHFVVPQKYASIFYAVQVVLNWIIEKLKVFNDSTNKLSKSQLLQKTTVSKIIALLILGIGLNINTIQAQNKHFGRIYFKKYTIEKADTSTGSVSMYSTDSTLYFGISTSVDVFLYETKTKDYSIGAIPGGGYGFKYNPYKWKNRYLLSVDLFLQGGLQEIDDIKYFRIQMLPTIGVLGWFHAGYGYSWRLGLDGATDIKTPVFTCGINIPVN